MFPAIKPWPMTLAPMNEAVRCDNQAEKTFVRKNIHRHDREVMEDVRTVLPSNTHKIFVRVGDLILIISDYFAYFIECYL